MCDWVTLLYSKNLTEHCKPTIMEKIKIILKKLKLKKKKNTELHMVSSFLKKEKEHWTVCGFDTHTHTHTHVRALAVKLHHSHIYIGTEKWSHEKKKKRHRQKWTKITPEKKSYYLKKDKTSQKTDIIYFWMEECSRII